MGLTHLARNLRKNQTDAEQILWMNLRGRRLLDQKFRRQFPIFPYIVDFICLELKLIIELDGGQHASHDGKDSERTQFLILRGFKVIRFWNDGLFNNLEGVLTSIALEVEKQKTMLDIKE